jgi:hypothetical protein
MAKILFVGQSTKHFSYYESLVRALSDRGHNVVFRYDPSFSENTIHPALQNFLKQSSGQFLWIPKPSKLHSYFIYFIRELRTYSWYLRRTDQAKYYVDRWADLFPFVGNILKTPLAKRVLSRRWIFDLLSKIERLIPVGHRLRIDILDVCPDLVMVSPGNMRYSAEIDYIKAAKKLGIPSIISVFSWDNLTNKGLFHWHPDLFLVWNKHHKNELIRLHCATPKEIVIVGALLFDKWQSIAELAEPMDEIKLVTSNPYILYLGSSSNIAKDEAGILQRLATEVHKNGGISRILFKPHPGHQAYYNSMDIEGVKVLGSEYGLTETHQDIANMKWLIEKSDFVIGINTSGMIDSVILGKETYAYVSAEYSETQKLSAHFKVLSEYGVVCEIEKYHDAMTALCYKEEFQLRRNAFIAEFIRPVNLRESSGIIAAEIVDSFLQSCSIKDCVNELNADTKHTEQGKS